MSYNQTSNPTSYPVLIQMIKEWTRVDSNTSDAELSGLIASATARAEIIMDRPIINRTITYVIDDFGREICIKPQVQSVDIIQYVDSDGATQTLSTSVYNVDLGSEHAPARITEAFNQSFPTTRDENNAVTVTFTAGYGADWNSCPQDIQRAIAYLVSHYYDNRDVVGENKMIPETAVDILMGHKVYSV